MSCDPGGTVEMDDDDDDDDSLLKIQAIKENF